MSVDRVLVGNQRLRLGDEGAERVLGAGDAEPALGGVAVAVWAKDGGSEVHVEAAAPVHDLGRPQVGLRPVSLPGAHEGMAGELPMNEVA